MSRRRKCRAVLEHSRRDTEGNTSMPHNFTCKQCGREFRTRNRARSVATYCSPRCSSMSRRKDVKQTLADFIQTGHPDECWEWKGTTDPKGYGRFARNGRNLLAHRASWEVVNGPIPEGLCALHKCDNPACCNPNHLFIGTKRDNALDRTRKGRTGKRPPTLTPEQDAEVRHLRRQGETYAAIGRIFGVSGTTIVRSLRRTELE